MGEIIERKNIELLVNSLKSRGSKIVFTNGCFDILHAGHVRYLKEAKGLGNVLIVGLNSDRSIGKIKEGRPIVPESERAEVLASLSMVDYVVLFDEETPYDLIRLVRPDILVKGGDWKKEDIVGFDIVAEVRALPYHYGLSTTEIIRRVLSSESSQ